MIESSKSHEEYSECRIENMKYTSYGITAQRTLRNRDRLTGVNKYSLFAGPDQDIWQFIPVTSSSKHPTFRYY
jgi:hypothetical protein